MEYRTFTEKDKSAIATALMVFLREMDGKIRKSRTLLPIVESALERGLTLDQIFNRQNWLRAFNATNGNLAPDNYIDLMYCRSITCREIKEEDGWCDDMETMSLLAKCFHDFYMQICPKGGTWSTDNARLNLEKAIRMHSLQAIMSEKAITDAMQASGDGQELTCFNYVLCIIKEKVEIQDLLTEQQTFKRQRDEEFEILDEEADAEDNLESPGDKKLRAEPEPEDDDATIYPDDENDEDEEFYNLETDTFVSMMNPREMKRSAIISIIYNYMMDELNELITLVPDVTTLADFIEKLTDGNIDTTHETAKAREIHQLMNGELLPSFITCISMQGFEMTEELALTHDPLTEKWDFRDERTRKVHKLKRLIYTHGNEDQDLLNCIPDIEKVYSEE